MPGQGVLGSRGSRRSACCSLRLLLVRQLTGWTYAELAFHLADSMTYRAFCRVSALVATPSKSALAATLRRVTPRTLAVLNDQLITSAAARAIEPARTVRMDATVVPRVKRRAMEIAHLAPQRAVRRCACYRELLQLTETTATYATCALAHLECLPATPARERVRGHLTPLLPRVAQVIDQTTRRVLHGGPGAPAGAPSPARGGEWSVPSR